MKQIGFKLASAIKLTMSALILLMYSVSSMVAVAQSQSAAYSEGMSAYMNGDFEAAQSNWLQAAQQNNGRAMFNLGLLHERQRVAGANEQAAIDWFAKAGDAGYAPADYHLALKLQSNGDQQAANRLLQRAASAGFILAREVLGMPSTVNKSVPQNQAAVTTVQSANTQSPDTSSEMGQTQASPRIYQRESWILNQPADAWTVQMLAFSDEAKVRNFIDDHALHRKAAYFAQGKGDTTIYKLIYGSYATKQEAADARSGFTSSLKENGPWLRPIKGIQALLNGG